MIALGGRAYGCGRAKPRFHLVVAYEAGLLVHELSIVQDEEIGDAANVVAGGQIMVLIGIHFEHDSLPGKVGGGTGDFGGGHAAGSAPISPEIDEHGDAGVLQDLVEERRVGGEGLIDGRQRVLAGAAAACVS